MATASADVNDRIPIALPEQMPTTEPHVATADERRRAEGSLAKLAGLPRDQLRGILCKIPGVGTNVEDIMSAFSDLPPSAYAFVTSNLPADRIRMLQKWHKDNAVSEWEKHRNQAIFAIQGNRNPFIDLPALAERIDFRRGLAGAGNKEAPANAELPEFLRNL